MADPRLVGAHIVLRPLVVEDAAVCHHWLNDPEVQRTLAVHGRTISEADSRAFILGAAGRGDRLFAIETRAEGSYIGNAGLHGIDPEDGRAELGLVIGAKEAWGRGYGGEVVMLLCQHAFDDLGLHRVSLSCFANNPRALALYARLGFVREGVRREAHRIDDAWVDEIVLGLLRDEFRRSR